MKDYLCRVRGYIYQPKLGDPDCGSAKEDFEELE